MRENYKTARCILYREDQFLLAVHGGFWGRRHQRWGLPGGQIERGEAPATAAAREIEEELNVSVSKLLEVGAFPYKQAMHMVYAAEIDAPISDWDESELIDIRWFTFEAIWAISWIASARSLSSIRFLIASRRRSPSVSPGRSDSPQIHTSAPNRSCSTGMVAFGIFP